jgi:hypothetical protein
MKIISRRQANPALAAALDRQSELRAELRALNAEAQAILATDQNEDRASRAAALIGGAA